MLSLQWEEELLKFSNLTQYTCWSDHHLKFSIVGYTMMSFSFLPGVNEIENFSIVGCTIISFSILPGDNEIGNLTFGSKI